MRCYFVNKASYLFLFALYVFSSTCFADNLFSKEMKLALASKEVYLNKEFFKSFPFHYSHDDGHIRVCDDGVLYIFSKNSIYAWDNSVLNFRKFINLKHEEANVFFEGFWASGGCFFLKGHMIISGQSSFQGGVKSKVFVLGKNKNYQIDAQIIRFRENLILICEQEKCDVPSEISNDFIVRRPGEGVSRAGMNFYISWNKEKIVFASPDKLKKGLGGYGIFCLNLDEIESEVISDFCLNIWERYGDYLEFLEHGDDIIFYDDNPVLDDPLFFLCKSLVECAPANFVKGYSPPQIYKFHSRKYFLAKRNQGDYGALFCLYGKGNIGASCKNIEGDNRFILFFERGGVGYSFQYENERCNGCLALYRWHKENK